MHGRQLFRSLFGFKSMKGVNNDMCAFPLTEDDGSWVMDCWAVIGNGKPVSLAIIINEND